MTTSEYGVLRYNKKIVFKDDDHSHCSHNFPSHRSDTIPILEDEFEIEPKLREDVVHSESTTSKKTTFTTTPSTTTATTKATTKARVANLK